MNKLTGFGLLLIAAIGIGIAGTLTKVMSQQAAYALTSCPPNWKPDPTQTTNDQYSRGALKCLPKSEFIYVPLTREDKMQLCASMYPELSPQRQQEKCYIPP